MNFVELCVEGDVLFSEIHDFIDKWHKSDSDEKLHEFLGLSEREYSKFLRNEDALIDIIKSKKEVRPLNLTSVNTNLIHAIIGKEEVQLILQRNWSNFNPENHVLISIQDPDDKDDLSKYHKQFKDCLNIRFWDIEEDIGKYVAIQDKEAKEIADFISKNRDESFFIHCAAGVSRSAGTGLAVECIVKYNGDKYSASQFPSEIKNHFRYSPNLTVFDAIVGQYSPIEMKNSCDKCGASFNEDFISGLKDGVETKICPRCFN